MLRLDVLYNFKETSVKRWKEITSAPTLLYCFDASLQSACWQTLSLFLQIEFIFLFYPVWSLVLLGGLCISGLGGWLPCSEHSEKFLLKQAYFSQAFSLSLTCKLYIFLEFTPNLFVFGMSFQVGKDSTDIANSKFQPPNSFPKGSL